MCVCVCATCSIDTSYTHERATDRRPSLADDHTLTMMLSSLDAGVVRVEREGLSAESPCRALRLASFTPEGT